MTQDLFTLARQAVATALVQSDEIAAFVSEAFPGKRLKVFREVLVERPPSADSCPFVALSSFTHAQSDKDPHRMEHTMSMGVFMDRAGDYVGDNDGLFVVQSAAVLDQLSGMVERVASAALLSANFSFDQDPFLDDSGLWSEFFGSFYLYRVRTTRRINL